MQQNLAREPHNEGMDLDESQLPDYSSEGTTSGGNGARSVAEDDLDSTIQNLIAEISRNQARRTQARNERMCVAQADAAVNQIKVYLREWVAQRRGQLDRVTRAAATDMRLLR